MLFKKHQTDKIKSSCIDTINNEKITMAELIQFTDWSKDIFNNDNKNVDMSFYALEMFGRYIAQNNLDLPDDFIEFLMTNNYFTAPGSRNRHGSHTSGLFCHSICMAEHLAELTQKLDLKWENKRSPYLIGLFHDICKVDLYNAIVNLDFITYDHNKNALLNGHGDKSIAILSQFPLNLTMEEILCIRWHMGAFDDKSNWECYSMSCAQYPNVLWTHTADMYVSQVLKI